MASRSQKYIEGLILRGFSPAQAQALAGNIQSESAGNPTAYNPNEDAFGLMQWRLDRKTGLEKYAKATGRDASDPEAQMDWLAIEMTGPEARNAKAFLSAQDPASASAALKPYIRYAPGTENERLNNTLALAQGYAGQQGTPNMQANAQAGTSDDDLLKMFLGGDTASPGGTPAPASNDNGQMSDDDLLKLFLAAQSATEAPEKKPSGPSRNSPDVFTAQTAGAMGNNPMAAPGVDSVEYQEGKQAPTNYTPSSVPWLDPITAGANAAINSVPVVGPYIMGAVNFLDANANPLASTVIGGAQPETTEQRAKIAQAQQAQFPLATGAGTIAGTVAPFLAAGGIPAASRLLGMSGTIPQQVMMGGASNALIAGADTLTRGGSLADAGRNALIGGTIGAAAPALLGGNLPQRVLGGAALGAGGTVLAGGDPETIARNALLGAGGGSAFFGAAKLGNKLLGKTSPETARLAQAAIDEYGIPIGPGQMSDNPMVRFADDVISKMPFTGGGVNAAEQQTAFNRAVAQTFGENATKVTPDVMAAARDRIGNVFESVASRTPRIVGDTGFEDSMLDIITKAQQVLPDSELKPLMNQWDNIVNKFGEGGGEITGEIYQALTRKNAPLDLAVRSKDPNVRYFATQMRSALDDVFERSAPPEVLADLKQARSQWKAMKTVEDMVEKAPTGDLSPALLMGAARSSFNDMAYGGGGQLADLARIGQKFLKAPPSSGTAERQAIMNLLTKAGGVTGLAGAAAMNPGSLPMMAAIGGPMLAGTYLAAKGGNALLRSKGLANRLIANSLGTSVPANVSTTLPKQLVRTATGAGTLQEQRKR